MTENLCSVDMKELLEITKAAIEKHPERATEILKDFSMVCKRNGKYTDLDLIMGTVQH